MPVTIAQAVFAMYLFMVLLVGLYAAKFTEERPSDFYVADRKVGTLILGLTLTATVLSSFTVFGIGAVTIGTGFGAYSYLSIAAIFYTFMFAVVGVALLKIGKEMDIVTPSEYIRKRYDSPIAGVVYLSATGVFMIGMVSGQLIGGGVALDALVGIPYMPAVIAMAVFMVVYMHIAGYRGVIWSDAIQSAVLFVVLASVFTYVMVFLDSSAMAVDAAAEVEGLFTLVGPVEAWTPLAIITAALAFTLGVPFYPQSIQRYFSASSTSTMRKSGFLFALIAIPMYFFAAGLGAWSLGVISVPENPDYVIPLIIETLTHPVVFGIAMAGAVSALMSTADSVALTMSSMISRDVYLEYINPDASERKEVLVTQAMLIVVIFLAVVLAYLQPAGIFDLIAFAVVGFAATSAPVLLGLYWDRATSQGAIASLIFGPAATILFFLEVIPAEYTFGIHYGLVGALIAYAVFIVVSFVTSAPSTDAIKDHSKPLWEEAD
jgi:solute:Na+ symporter, SSS family